MEGFSETDKAYLAGLIDGEGCITITKNKAGGKYNRLVSYHVTLMIAQKRPLVLNLFRDKTAGLGRVYARKNGVHCWHLNSNQALEVIHTVYDYLIIKKDQADILIEFSETEMHSGNRSATQRADNESVRAVREELFQRIKALHAASPACYLPGGYSSYT